MDFEDQGHFVTTAVFPLESSYCKSLPARMVRMGANGVFDKRFNMIMNLIVHKASDSPETESTSYDSDCDYDLDLDSYQPIRPLASEHDVMIITPRILQLSLQTLQIMNHGTTMIQWDEDGGRSVPVLLRLEADNATLTWCRPGWSALRGVTSPPDFILHSDRAHTSLHVLWARYSSVNEETYNSLEEGYLDVLNIKEVYLGEEGLDLSAIGKRHGLDSSIATASSSSSSANAAAAEGSSADYRCITIVHGSSMSSNHKLWFVGPPGVALCWYRGLRSLRLAAARVRAQMDKRVLWLKQQYLQLYYENEKCQGPTPAEAVKVRRLRNAADLNLGRVI
ncbi:phosphoinositide phospholipase C [Elysia marginata]|uniref:Phosphoinositide phospholipase C n=1 Tax=Elysia marginata TaxID=1093978 RepID=A0AAV4GCW3_9GAST|nr:phosphoinositide phospholipase C [Elysia marginata]